MKQTANTNKASLALRGSRRNYHARREAMARTCLPFGHRGEIGMVLNPQDLLASMRKSVALPEIEAVATAGTKRAIQLAEDSITTRSFDAGANAYLAKPAFDQQLLLDCRGRLI